MATSSLGGGGVYFVGKYEQQEGVCYKMNRKR